MGKGDELKAAKRAYKEAKEVGNLQEEARWANVIGNILKNQGQYVEALSWLRKDYDISMKHLPVKHQIPTCQSLGEVHLRLQDYTHALIYQKKHLELAKDANDLVEQQRASTQLGRTYHEIFLNTNGEHGSVRNAKKHFRSAMELAETLKRNPPSNRQSFVKEYIDAHNNLGMLEMDLDNLEEAQKFLTKGLETCDEEEVEEDDDGRSRLHHNLGNVYMELRKWDDARKHIEKDIVICNRIGHCQGEAKGYINLGELHYRNQKYNEATLCYKKAHKLATSMMDEDALVSQIKQNIETVEQARKIMHELQKEEQNLKRLARSMEMARGTAAERKCLLQQNASLDILIEKSRSILSWRQFRAYAKRKKTIARELCDQEKLSDSFLVIGESYQNLRNFDKALKWYIKSWEIYKLIGNLEGQALAKINIGDVLDADGDWAGALTAFEEGYRIAIEAKRPSIQLSALENMHYSHMIRFDNVDAARELQELIDRLKQSKGSEVQSQEIEVDCCSESETENDDQPPNSRSDVSFSSRKSDSKASKLKSGSSADEMNEDIPLISLLSPHKRLAKLRTANVAASTITKKPESSPRNMSRSADSQTFGRKRIRVVYSDDEDEDDGIYCSRGLDRQCPVEDVATSDEFQQRSKHLSANDFEDVSPVGSRCAIGACTLNVEESSSSYKSMSTKFSVKDGQNLRFSLAYEADGFKFGANYSKTDAETSGNLSSKCNYSFLNLDACGDDCQHIIFKIDEDLLHMKLDLFLIDDKLGMEQMVVEVACLYFLQLPVEKRSRGLAPVIQHIIYGGNVIESLEAVKTLKDNMLRNDQIEVSIGAWVPKRMMKLYIDCCKELSEPPNLKVLKGLYNLQVSEDEIIVSDCELQDISVAPLLSAMHAHKTISVLDLSHNLLGNGTMERLQQVFTSSEQSYGGLVLDLHCNRLGPTALFQICECPVLYARLEVLNISGNRLTDSCATYLSTILCNCKALYSLNIENCSITSRTIQKIADSLDSGSVVTHLSIGHNNPISGNAITILLHKLANLKRIQELNLNGIKLSKPVVHSLCQFSKNSCLSGLMLGSTSIGTEGASQLTKSLSNETQELLKLDLSSCGLTSDFIVELSAHASLISSILELNLGGNPIKAEGTSALVSLLVNPQCCLKVLVLDKCQLGLVGVLQILQALVENCYLEELNLAENVYLDDIHTAASGSTSAVKSSNSLEKHLNLWDSSNNASPPEVNAFPHESYGVNTDCTQLEVADSDDDQVHVEVAASALDENSTCLSQKKPLIECNLFHELSEAIRMAKQLQMLDLSNNGLSPEVAETLYMAWSSSRGGLTRRHLQKNIVHFSVNGKKCCSAKPCCRRF